MTRRKLTVRQRMEALGWYLVVWDDDLSAGWRKAHGSNVVAYQRDAVWHDDLARCTAEAKAAGAMIYA